LKRAVPLTVFILTTLIAGLLAFGVNIGIGSVVAPSVDVDDVVAVATADDSRSGSPAVNRSATGRSERDYIDTILKRNIFDIEAIAAYNPTAAGTRAGSEPITDLKVVLMGTVVATPALYSSALIADESSASRAIGYGIGDKLQDAEILKIEAKVVTLKRGDGRIETLSMDEGRTERPASSSASSGDSDDGEGVEKLAENRYAVDRSLIDKYVGDMESISRMGRALLHRGPDGDFDGYRLSAIRRNTLADQLGIKNGDVVHSVNGQALNSVQGAMGAYQGMMSESNFTFEITRRGQRVTMEYEVR
jgi:general secretion pathway protein C